MALMVLFSWAISMCDPNHCHMLIGPALWVSPTWRACENSPPASERSCSRTPGISVFPLMLFLMAGSQKKNGSLRTEAKRDVNFWKDPAWLWKGHPQRVTRPGLGAGTKHWCSQAWERWAGPCGYLRAKAGGVGALGGGARPAVGQGLTVGPGIPQREALREFEFTLLWGGLLRGDSCRSSGL